MTTYFFQAPQQNAEQIRQYNVFRSQVINEGWRTLDLWDYNTRVHVESVVSQRKVDRFEEEALFKKRYRHIKFLPPSFPTSWATPSIIRFGRCLRLPDSAQAPPSQNMVRASHFFGDVLYLRAGAYDHYMGIPKMKVVPGETKKEDVPEVPVLEIPVVVEQKESAVKEDTVTIQKVKATKKQAKKISSHQSSSCQHPRRKHRFGDFLDSSLFQAVPIQIDPEEATEEDIPEVLIPEISAMEHTTETQEKEVAKESTVESQEKEVVKKPVTKEHTVETQEKEIAKTHVVKENPDETLEVMKKPVAEENTVEPQGKDVVKKPVDEEQITKTQEKETMKKPVAKEHTLEPEEKEVVKKLITEERSVKTQEKRVVKKPAAKEHSVETKEKEVVKKPAKKILGDFLDSSLFQESRSKKSNQRKAEVPKKKDINFPDEACSLTLLEMDKQEPDIEIPEKKNELTSTKDITDENPTHDVDSDPINVDCPAELKSDMPGVEKEKRKETKKKKNEKKRNRSDKKKEEETEDEMLDRLIKENQEASKQQLIEDKFVASFRDSTKSYQKGRKQKVTEKKSSEVEKDKNGLQELVTGKIAELEQKSFLEMFFAECSYGELVVETVKRAVNSFIDDIESVISKGMHPDNVKNKMYHLFEKMVVLPTPNEEIKTAAQRFENVHDAMWARIELYIKNDDRYEKVRCFSYIYLLDCIEHRRVAVVPTLEKLLNADGSGVSERFEDEEEEEFLKLLLSDYDDMFSIEEKKSN